MIILDSNSKTRCSTLSHNALMLIIDLGQSENTPLAVGPALLYVLLVQPYWHTAL